MTITDTILNDLRHGPSTADSIAGRLALPTEEITALCLDLVIAGTLSSVLIGGHPQLSLYSLSTH